MIRRELSALDRDVPIANVRAMTAFLDDSTSDARFRTLLVGAFAALAVLIAVVGVAGVISYAVSRRTHELGVRVARGATRGQILSLVLRQGMRPTAIGLAMGLCGAVALTRVIAGLLFAVSTMDLAVFAASTALLTVAALTATYVPAHRATTVDPMHALRAE
jgi:putative ABC transport system permease protein